MSDTLIVRDVVVGGFLPAAPAREDFIGLITDGSDVGWCGDEGGGEVVEREDFGLGIFVRGAQGCRMLLADAVYKTSDVGICPKVRWYHSVNCSAIL